MKNKEMKCSICKGKLRLVFYSEDYRYNVKGKFPYYRCDRCGTYSLVLDKPVMGYPDEKYYSYRQKKRGDLKERFSSFLYPLFYTYNFNPLSLLFLIFKPFTRGTRIRKGDKFLDVGCGNGAFLRKMKEQGMKVYGIEPGKIPGESIKDFNIQNVQVANSSFSKNSFDTIAMNHVIEHSSTPVQDINKIYSYLKPGGMFIIAAPNTGSLAFKIFRKYWVQVDAPRHIFLFDKDNLKHILTDAGFKIKKTRYNSMPFQFISSLKFYFKTKGKDVGLLESWPVRYGLIPFCFLLNLLQLGDQVEIWAEKT